MEQAKTIIWIIYVNDMRASGLLGSLHNLFGTLKILAPDTGRLELEYYVAAATCW